MSKGRTDSQRPRELIRQLRPDNLPDKERANLIPLQAGSIRMTIPKNWLQREEVDLDEPGEVSALYFEEESKIVLDLAEANKRE